MDNEDIDQLERQLKHDVGCHSVRNLRRRSSLAHSIRKSRSVLGIPFEDLISAVDRSSPVEERLYQVFTLSVGATLNAVASTVSCRDQEDTSNSPESVVHLIKDHLRFHPTLNGMDDERLKPVTEMVAAMQEEEQGQEAVRIVPVRLKTLRTHLNSVNKESEQWMQMHKERISRFNETRHELKQVLSGDLTVTPEIRQQLPKAEDAGIRSLSDGRCEMEKLELQVSYLEAARRHLNSLIAKRSQLLDKHTEKLERAAEQLCQETDRLHQVPLIHPIEPFLI